MTDSSPQISENGKIQGSENKAPIVVILQLAKQFGKLSAIDNLNMTINGITQCHAQKLQYR